MNLKKKELIKKQIKSDHGCAENCNICTKNFILIDKMEEANIPVGYWLLTMKNFYGSDKLKDIVLDYINNIDEKYIKGQSICFAGNQGTGKTMSSLFILKTAIKHGYSTYYTTAIDILNETTKRDSYNFRDLLKKVDFLIIDELDSRFFPSDSSKELFSGIYENIFRTRSHNLLPTIICTNETDGILNVFYGAAVNAISSLNNQYLKTYPVAGKDFRKNVSST